MNPPGSGSGPLGSNHGSQASGISGIVPIKDGVDKWGEQVSIQDLFGPDVKGRVLLDSLFELYQVT